MTRPKTAFGSAVMLTLLVVSGSRHIVGQTSGTRPQIEPVQSVPASPPRLAPVELLPGSKSSRPMQSDIDRFKQSRQYDHLLSSTIDGDHENAGMMTNGEDSPDGNVVYTGIYANHVVYESGSIVLKPPPSSAKQQTLFAATTRPPNGGCLEVGTAYTSDTASSNTSVALYVFDFCRPGGHSDWAIPPYALTQGSSYPCVHNGAGGTMPPLPIDAHFMSTYTFKNSDGLAEYTVAIATQTRPITSASTWTAQLYNYSTHSWDTICSEIGYADVDKRGWSIFETWYQQGLCSESLPIFGADDIRYFNWTTAAWDTVSPNMGTISNQMTRGGSHNHNCFLDDATGPASYSVQPSAAGSYWRVLSR